VRRAGLGDGTNRMGTTATFLACRAGAAAPAAGDPWTPLPQVAEGWTVCTSRLVPDDLAAVLHDVPEPTVIGLVMFSDDCWLVGALDGTVAWEWSFGGEYERSGGLAAVANDPSVDLDAMLASRMQAVLPQIVAWAATAGLGAVTPDRLEAVLERGFICAEDSVFALLNALGVTPPPARPPVGPVTRADDATVDQPPGELVGEMVMPPSGPAAAPAGSGSRRRADRADPAAIRVLPATENEHEGDAPDEHVGLIEPGRDAHGVVQACALTAPCYRMAPRRRVPAAAPVPWRDG
jgi:hypothetical protein